MLKIKEILRLKCEAKLSNRKIARALNISHSVVNEYTKEFKLTNKKYEDVISLGDKEILVYCAMYNQTSHPNLLPFWSQCIDTLSLSRTDEASNNSSIINPN